MGKLLIMALVIGAFAWLLVMSMQPGPATPHIRRKAEFIGVGALVQLVGLVLLFFFPLGTIAGVLLLIIGSAMSVKTICSSCGNKVEKTSKLCPTCKASFEKSA